MREWWLATLGASPRAGGLRVPVARRLRLRGPGGASRTPAACAGRAAAATRVHCDALCDAGMHCTQLATWSRQPRDANLDVDFFDVQGQFDNITARGKPRHHEKASGRVASVVSARQLARVAFEAAAPDITRKVNLLQLWQFRVIQNAQSVVVRPCEMPARRDTVGPVRQPAARGAADGAGAARTDDDVPTLPATLVRIY